MLNQEERAAKFFDAITKDAEERHEELTRKTRETVDSGLEKAKAKAHSQAQARIERERMLKEQEFNRTVADERTRQRARLTDMRFADDIKKAFGRDCKVESSDEITIGGCRAGVAGGSTVADDTLDTRLEAQREWFLENSGMSVIL